jgi:soluble lytic murein transglycosylase-like protein
MLKQEWAELWFGVCVRLISAARRAWAATPLLAALAVTAGLALVRGPSGSAGDELDRLAARFALETGAEPVEQPAATDAAPAAASPFKATREQQNIARFLAEKYRLATEQTQELVVLAYRTARDVKIDPWLMLAVISVESNFNPTAQSNRGAQGLMQVLTRVHADRFAPFGGVAAAFDPLANMQVGAQILKEYLLRDGNVEAALKSYVGAAQQPHDGGYGAKVLTERDRIAAVAAGRPLPPPRPVLRAEAAAPAPSPARERIEPVSFPAERGAGHQAIPEALPAAGEARAHPAADLVTLHNLPDGLEGPRGPRLTMGI